MKSLTIAFFKPPGSKPGITHGKAQGLAKKRKPGFVIAKLGDLDRAIGLEKFSGKAYPGSLSYARVLE